MTRYMPHILSLSAALVVVTLLVPRASAQDVPDDVLRAVTGEEKPVVQAEPKTSRLGTPDVISDEPAPLIEAGDAAESQLNRAVVRYENLARKWPGGLKAWQERARETLLRIDELMSDPELTLPEGASSGLSAEIPGPTRGQEHDPEPTRGMPGATDPMAPPAFIQAVAPGEDGDVAKETVSATGKQPRLPSASAPLDIEAPDQREPMTTATNTAERKGIQTSYEALARRCEELSEELRKLAAALRKVNSSTR